MNRRFLASIALGFLLILSGCGSCGFDCDSDDDEVLVSTLTLGFSDEALESLKQVVLEVDKVVLGRSSGEDVTVDTFTIADLGLVDEDTFQFDLLDYRGRNQLEVFTEPDLDTGSYNQIRLVFIDGDINSSYVQESDDTLKQLTSPSGGLSLPTLVLDESTEAHTVEFSLAQSLRYRSSSDDYLLSADGIRIEDTADAASIIGRLDSGLFDSVEPCDAKTDPLSGNRIYLYEGIDLAGTLADVHTSASATDVPDNVVAPYAVASLTYDSFEGTWEYVFGYLPAGDYTMAFSCDAANDDPVDYDAYTVPLPDPQRYELTLSTGEQLFCDLEDGATCP